MRRYRDAMISGNAYHKAYQSYVVAFKNMGKQLSFNFEEEK